ncbi:hypothetical protein ACXDF8_07590 [Mycolicibacterium sp. CBM1]
MNEVVDERKYAWRMIRAARRTQSAGDTDSGQPCRSDVVLLLEQALDAGLDRAELIVELADLGARMFALCDPSGADSTDLPPRAAASRARAVVI